MALINPQTGRFISRGGLVHRRLITSGILPMEALEDEAILSDSDSEEAIKRVNKKLPRHIQAVRGRGKYAGTTVRRNMPQNWSGLTEDSSDCEGDEEDY
jgi:hypothetical protein